MLKVNQLLFAVILASACAAPFKTLSEDKNMEPQPVRD